MVRGPHREACHRVPECPAMHFHLLILPHDARHPGKRRGPASKGAKLLHADSQISDQGIKFGNMTHINRAILFIFLAPANVC